MEVNNGVKSDSLSSISFSPISSVFLFPLPSFSFFLFSLFFFFFFFFLLIRNFSRCTNRTFKFYTIFPPNHKTILKTNAGLLIKLLIFPGFP